MSPYDIRIRHSISAARADVYKACSNSGILEQWFYPGGLTPEVATNTLTVQETKSENDELFGHAPKPSDPPGEPGSPEEYYHVSKILEMSPPDRIVFLWSSKTVRESKVTLVFREEEELTEIDLTHEGLESDSIRETLLSGWVESLALLTIMLESDESIGPQNSD